MQSENPYESSQPEDASAPPPQSAAAQDNYPYWLVSLLIVGAMLLTSLSYGMALPLLVAAVLAPLRASLVRYYRNRNGRPPFSDIGVLISSFVQLVIFTICSIITFVIVCSTLGRPAQYFVDPTVVGVILAGGASMGVLVGLTAISIKISSLL